jgi:hypothetical protein
MGSRKDDEGVVVIIETATVVLANLDSDFSTSPALNHRVLDGRALRSAFRIEAVPYGGALDDGGGWLFAVRTYECAFLRAWRRR